MYVYKNVLPGYIVFCLTTHEGIERREYELFYNILEYENSLYTWDYPRQ